MSDEVYVQRIERLLLIALNLLEENNLIENLQEMIKCTTRITDKRAL